MLPDDSSLTQARHAELFERERPRMFDLAYRMLASAADADDIVQEAYLRFQRAGPDSLEHPSAYLATVVTRLSIDHLRRLRREREHYVGPWLPEPLLTDTAPTPDQHAALAESLSLAMLLVMEQLDPVERAVFLLREVFDFDYPAIADVVEKSEANCRQLLHRARERLAGTRSRSASTIAEQQRLSAQFKLTLATGDLAGLMHLLAEEVVEYSDSGGKVPAARRAIAGADHVARYFIGLMKKAPADFNIRDTWLNGRPGFVTYEGGRPTNLVQLDIEAGKIIAIYVQRNPDKLRRVPPLGR
jgi:RNA polymerase sigma-70 factor (ECF subfamily)